MDDLDNLIWGSNATKPPTQKNNNTPLNAMRGDSTIIPATKSSTSIPLRNKIAAKPSPSNQNIFRSQANNANLPVFNRFNKDDSNSSTTPIFLAPELNIPSTNSTLNRSPLSNSPAESPKLSPAKNNTEAFDNLLSFNKKSTNLSLLEQLKLQEQEQRRKAQEEHQRITKHYDQTNFWDSLEKKGSGSSSPLPQLSGDLFDDILTTSSSEFGSFETAQNNPLKDKTPLTRSIPAGNNINKWDTNFLSNNTTTSKEKFSSTTDDLLDFGIFDKPPSSVSPTKVDEDKIDPLSIQAKPIMKNKNIISESNFQDLNVNKIPNDDSKDHLIAQIVEMGFSAAEADTALAATDGKEDVQSAIEILFQQREAEDQLRKRQADKRDTFKTKQDLGRRRSSSTLSFPRRDDDGDDDSEPGFSPHGRYSSKSSPFSVPKRNIYGRNASDGESSDRSSSSTSSNFYQSKEKLISTASEFGLSALKKASELYKQSKDKVNKALVELQLQHELEEDSARRPRWMQDNEFQESDDYSSEKYGDSNGKLGGKSSDKRGGLQKIASSCDNTSSENLDAVNLNRFGSRHGDKYGRLEKFHDSYDDDSSSDEDQPVIDNFVPVSSNFKRSDEGNRMSNYDLVDSKKSPKPPKPAVPPRFTKPNIDFNNSSYISPARRRPHTNSTPTIVGEPSPPKIVKAPRPTVHVSQEQMRNSEFHKAKGNETFKLGQFGEAEKFYSLAIDCLPSKHIQLAVLYNNRATAKLKNGDQRGCAEDCTLALQLIDDYTLPPPPGVSIDLKTQYTKALLRRASAYESMEKYDKAKDDYQKLMNVDPNSNKKVSDGLRRCQQAINMSSSDIKPVQNGSNSYGFDDNFTFSSTQTSANISTYQMPLNTFVAPLNEFGFIDPTMVKPATSILTTETIIDPNNPAVVKLRNQTRQQEFEDAEKLRCKDQVDQKIMQWVGGKETNIRALISSLDIVLWEGLGWKTIGLHELVTPAQVKIKYMKAIGKVHPDKLDSSTTIEQRLIAN
ncbi:1948_t:CDS:2, partial [Scutellospora calospora]